MQETERPCTEKWRWRGACRGPLLVNRRGVVDNLELGQMTNATSSRTSFFMPASRSRAQPTTRQRWLPLLLLALAAVSIVTYWRAPLTMEGGAMPAGGFDTAMLLTARRRAHSVALPLIAPAVVATARTAPTVPTAEPAPSTATTGHMLPHAEGGAPFSPGQSEQARVSVRMAIEKQRPPPGPVSYTHLTLPTILLV